MSLIKFKIPARARKCLVCDKRFEDQDKVFSTVEGDEEEPLRKDYCESCFKEQSVGEPIWGHWYIVIKKEKVQLTPDQKAMELFKEAQHGSDPQYLLFIAQYLKRKRQLVQRPEIRKEEILFFEDPKSSEVYGITKAAVEPEKLILFKEQFLAALNKVD